MSDEPVFEYGSPRAFGAALTDRLKVAAKESIYDLVELRRQFAYDRLLARVFTADSHRWILKGGGGLLARIPGQARHSMDLDLFYRGELEAAVADIENIGADDSFGDFFTFDILPNPGQFGGGATGANLGVVAFLGEKEFQRFNVDIVITSNMTKEPDIVAALAPVSIPGLRVVDYIVYSVVDHVADKHAAMIATYGEGNQSSTRYRDLVDLVLVATTQQVDATELRAALLSEYRHRGLEVARTVDAPDRSWDAGYAREAAKVPHLDQQTLSAALAVARGFLEPVLSGEVAGLWSPTKQKWTDNPQDEGG